MSAVVNSVVLGVKIIVISKSTVSLIRLQLNICHIIYWSMFILMSLMWKSLI